MDSSPTPLRIASRRILIGGGTEPFRTVPGILTIEGAWITGFEPLDDNTVFSEDTLDMGDKWITPSFVNAHTHIALGVMRGMDVESASAGNMVEEVFFRFESKCTKDDVLAFARVGAYACLLNGVGHVWDHYYYGDAVAQAMKEVGLTGVVAPTLQDLAGPGKDMWVDSLSATQSIFSDLNYASSGIFAALGPHATDTVSAALWTRAAKWSAQWGIPIHAHLAQSVEEVQRCRERHGQTPVQWLRELGVLECPPGAVFAHALFTTREDLSLLDPKRHHLVFCPYSQLIFGFPAPIHRWQEEGVSWVVATDCSANNDGNNVQQELRMVAGQRTVSTAWSAAFGSFFEGDGSAEDVWHHRGQNHSQLKDLGAPEALLQKVWTQPGAMHSKFRVGTIAVNAMANLTIWDTDHPSFWPPSAPMRTLAMADPIGAIHGMVVGGRIQGTWGDFHRSLWTSDAYIEARTEANERLRHLLRS